MNNNQNNNGLDYNYFQNFDYGDGNNNDNNVQTNKPVFNPQIEQNTEQYIKENNQSYEQLSNNYMQSENVQDKKVEKATRKFKKSWLIAGISAILVIIIAIIVVKTFLGGKMTDPIDDAVNYANKHEFEWTDYMKTSNYGPIGELHVMYQEYDNELYGDDVFNSDYYDRILATLENRFGEDYELTYEINDKERVKGSQLNDFKDYMDEYFSDALEDLEVDEMVEYYEENGLNISSSEKKKLEKQYKKAEKWVDKLKIGKVYELEVEFTIAGESDEGRFVYESITVAKINGQWMAFIPFGDIEVSESYTLFSLLPFDISNALEIYINYYEEAIY